MTKERKTLSVLLNGSDDYEGNFQCDDNYKAGEKVLVWRTFNTNYTTEFNKARTYDGDVEELEHLRKEPSYSDIAGNTTYFIGLFTVTRVFNRKMWVK